MLFETSFFPPVHVFFVLVTLIILVVFLRFAQVRGLADQRWCSRGGTGVKRNF